MKKIAVIVASLALFLVANSAFAELKVGVIDLNKVLAGSPQVADAKAQLKKQFDARGQEISNLQTTLKADVEDFNKNGPTMKADASKAAQQKIMEKQKKLQELETSFQADVSKAQNTAMEGIIKHVEELINKVATDGKYDLVITKMSAAYYNPKLDVTDAVVKLLK